jgi:glycosyltransferase involved in cell wall biosynthesis
MLEAIGAGLPVIAADTPEMRELFNSDRLLFDPDDVGALARKLETIDSNRQELDLLRTLSQTRLQKFIFDWGSAVVSLLEKAARSKALSKAKESE